MNDGRVPVTTGRSTLDIGMVGTGRWESPGKGIRMAKTMEAPWALVDRPDLTPMCPHCEESLTEVYRKGTGFPLAQGRTVVYFCPHCSKILGFAEGRMF